MKGVIVLNATDKSLDYTAQRMEEEFRLLDVEIRLIRNQIGLAGHVLQKKDIDFCLFYDKDIVTAKEIENLGIRVFNSSDAIAVCDDKMLTSLALRNKVKMPKTLPLPLVYFDRKEIAEKEYDTIKTFLGDKFIIKDTKSSLGMGVFLISNYDEYIDCVQRLYGKPLLAQKYVETSYGRDVRIIVIGGKAVASMLRQNSDSFKSGIATGGKGSAFDLLPGWKLMAEKAALVLGLDYCGVDILFGLNDEPILAEVNSNALSREVERVTGVNIANIYAEHIIKICSGSDMICYKN